MTVEVTDTYTDAVTVQTVIAQLMAVEIILSNLFDEPAVQGAIDTQKFQTLFITLQNMQGDLLTLRKRVSKTE